MSNRYKIKAGTKMARFKGDARVKYAPFLSDKCVSYTDDDILRYISESGLVEFKVNDHWRIEVHIDDIEILERDD